MSDFKARQKAKLNRLPGQRVRPRDHGLARDDGRRRRQRHHRQQRPIGIKQKKRILDVLWISENKSALAEIVQRKRRQCDEQPRELDRTTLEMSKIGVKRFRAGDDQEHRSQGQKANEAVREEKSYTVERIESGQHAGILDNVPNSRRREGDEPPERDRSEKSRDR